MKLDRDSCALAIESCACFAFARASRSVAQHYNSYLRQAGLRSTQFVLMAHVMVHEPTTMGLLAEEMVLDRSTLTRNLRPLIESGFIKVSRSKGVRAKLVQITAKGKRKLETTAPLWETAHALFIDSYGSAKWQTASKAVARVTETARAL